ncbi:hypothetical protein AXF42_Ash014782 [Apostasia shenzhenica]|uniref:Uncharacterized protein n=1 Tax=Apostasia shenzhenica TaxID=1088818 RepID=A0A2H9ZWD6_9ASPA|nr:hypothetical protein AXF42_Ash014782 [Apostasia shenzhenica]
MLRSKNVYIFVNRILLLFQMPSYTVLEGRRHVFTKDRRIAGSKYTVTHYPSTLYFKLAS